MSCKDTPTKKKVRKVFSILGDSVLILLYKVSLLTLVVVPLALVGLSIVQLVDNSNLQECSGNKSMDVNEVTYLVNECKADVVCSNNGTCYYKFKANDKKLVAYDCKDASTTIKYTNPFIGLVISLIVILFLSYLFLSYKL